jgi:hypothetical protein
MRNKPAKDPIRAGYSFLELQVAFVLLGIALAGLGPLVVMQSRQLKMLEARFDHQTTYYLAPSANAWARKLGADASIQTEAPDPTPPLVTLIDNGDPGYSETDEDTPDWETAYPPNAFHGAIRWNDGGHIGDKASWEFTGLAPGWYEVLVTFSSGSDRASDAPYTVYDELVAKGTVTVDQTVAPSGAVVEGVPWESLGLFSITKDTLGVALGDDANGNIIADAVRIVPVRNEVQVISLEKSLFSEQLEEVTACVSVTVQTP